MLDKVIKSAFRDAGLGVPRRLPLGELMLLVTLFAALFRLLTLVDAPAEVILYIACFTVGVAVCQAMMFDGRRPRDASMIAGTILCPAIFLVAYVLFRLGWVQDHANSAVEFVALFTVFTLLGPVLGYFAGLFVAVGFLRLITVAQDSREQLEEVMTT